MLPRFTQTNQARAILLCTTAFWFGIPATGWLFEAGAGIRLVAGFTATLGIASYFVLVGAILLGTELYPPRAAGSTRQTVLPVVSLVCCLVGFNWIARENVAGGAAGFLALLGSFAVYLPLFLLLPFLRRTQHKNLFYSGPVFLFFMLWVGPRVDAYEQKQTELRGDRIVAALKSFREREGAYPNTLEELTAQDIDEIPQPKRWFWLGSTFRYETSGFREPDKHPTAYKILYATHGDMRLGYRARSPWTEWFDESDFYKDWQFGLTFPTSWLQPGE